jgi:hypothetical protein
VNRPVTILLRATARAVAWTPQLTGSACALVLAWAAARNARPPAAALEAQLAGLVLAAALVTAAADRMGASVAAVPVALWRRRAATAAVCCAIPCLTWPLVLLAGHVGPATAGVLSLQLVAVAAAGLAIGFALPGQEAVVAGAIALGLGMARLLPPDGVSREIVAAAPTRAAGLCWTVLAMAALMTLLWSCRDPARRRRPRLTGASSRAPAPPG